MMLKIAIREETKNKWERRTPLVAEAVKTLQSDGIEIAVQKSPIRIQPEAEFIAAGAKIVDSVDNANCVLGIKEPVVERVQQGQIHVAFSHTIKGQAYNMPLLQRFIDQKASLIDYETIVDESGARLIAFGRYAGIAGAVDTLCGLGKKFAAIECDSPLTELNMTYHYETIETLKSALNGFDMQTGTPVQALIVGTGRVGQGAREVLEWVGLPEVTPEAFLAGDLPSGSWFCQLKSAHIHRRIDGGAFDYSEFVEYGKARYESSFDQALGKFNVLIQTPYWTEKYPKHLDAARMKTHVDDLPLVIGDISCDIDGSLECTQKASTIDAPFFSYNPYTGLIADTISTEADHPLVMSIDNLPCELSMDASRHFSSCLVEYIPSIAGWDLNTPLESLDLPEPIKKALIVYNGELTPDYQYLEKFLAA